MFRKLAPALVAPLLVVAACATEADDAAVDVRTGPEAVVALRSAPTAAAEAGHRVLRDGDGDVVRGRDLRAGRPPAPSTPTQQRMSMEMDMGSACSRGSAGVGGETVPDELDEPMQIVVDGSTVYLRAPAARSARRRGHAGCRCLPRTWAARPTDLGLGAGSYDPSKILESLRGRDGRARGGGHRGGARAWRPPATPPRSTSPRPSRGRPPTSATIVEAQLDQLGDGDDLRRRLGRRRRPGPPHAGGHGRRCSAAWAATPAPS